ncbi:protein MpTRIHELIX12 [Marchantia polymorpha subsp. ruderalis]|uniref:Myb-like domain-containing protein n=1 Tax=Marchantia polymorpha TaxID=3197 RepID=A0A2R6XBD9_MARPO|nr:hypothetical protein MARPO_0025s0112 [Marchantia polymorpha]BBN03702.1 hypothetical protein Mp_2g25660 [Marchantia polymorpha subsp. ruderalis]|eukprot:PTQ43430.1 hypothetical protein MARPO_0025s0112 [Marchantia polymorpha]
MGSMDDFAPDLELEDDGLFRGRMSFRDLLEEADEKETKPPPRKKKRGSNNVQSLLEAVIARQQKFFSDLLESIERKEQIREQIRQEKEDKWRAEERAQLGVFNNAMLVLTQELVGGDRASNNSSVLPLALTGSVVGSPEAGSVGPKRRSKNWKSSEVLQLIKLRGDMETRFAKCTKRAGLWDELAEGLAALGVKRDGKQCREKWDKLTAEYKDVVDGKRDQNESPYFAELTEILGRAAAAAAAAAAAVAASAPDEEAA